MNTKQNRDEFMLQAAWMYYYDDMTQQQIADKLGISRIKVTRLLRAARERGIVEIKLTRPLPINFEVRHRLERTFKLHDVIVVNTLPNLDATMDEIGRAGVEYIAKTLQPGMTLGFGWSSTVSRMAPHVHLLNKCSDCRVVDLVGSMLGKDRPYTVSQRVADALKATCHSLLVPIILPSTDIYSAIIQDPNIRHTLEIGRHTDIAVVGVGDFSPANALVSGGYLGETELNNLRQQGVVGDILQRFYDVNGSTVRHDADQRIVGLVWEEILKLPRVLVLAGGPTKPAPILGILRSGIPKTLITDLQTARSVLALHESETAQTDEDAE